jgi:thiol-disulfide isomerase/thioredoxin
MLERLLITLLLLALGVAVYWLYRHLQITRIQPTDPILAGVNLSLPTVVYFTTPHCVPCKTRQQPALYSLKQQYGVQVIQIDATEQPEVADRWGVMSAPTTFVLDAHGKPSAINHGVADEPLLKKQFNLT